MALPRVVTLPLAPAEGAARPAYPISSVDNALRLLLVLRERRALRLSEASDLVGCGRSTAHRLLAMLVYYGFASQDPRTRVYRATGIAAGLEAPPERPLVQQLARPILQVVARASGETSYLTELQGSSIVFIDSVESTTVPRAGSRRGVVYPAHCTSAGKAILAQLPTEQVRSLLGSEILDRLTTSSIGTFEALVRELEKVREKGYALNIGESQPGIFALGVPVIVPGCPPRFALTIAAPRTRLTAEAVRQSASFLMRGGDLLRNSIDHSLAGGSRLEAITAA
jgi:DNA-binding IclR family transcriptional regulator